VFSTVPGKEYAVLGRTNLFTTGWAPIGYATDSISSFVSGTITASTYSVKIYVDYVGFRSRAFRISVK
jgi:hypothetical protein